MVPPSKRSERERSDPLSGRLVLITGGAGFIGSRLAHQLVARGSQVAVLDSLHPQVHGPQSRSISPPAEAIFLTGDVTSASNWDTVFQRIGIPEIVVHLAAETGTGQSLTEATRHGATNVLGTTQMLDAFTRWEGGPKHLVLASSRAVYGEGAWADEGGKAFYPGPRSHEQLLAGQWDPVPPGGGRAVPLPSRCDLTRPEPTNIYAATKLAQEHLLRAWGAAMQVPLSVLRLQNVYGPGQSLTNSYTGIVALFCRLAMQANTIDVYEDGRIVRDFVHVDDVAGALLATLESPPASHRVLDVGSGQPATVHDLARTIARIAGAPEPKVSGRFRDGDVRAACCDLEPVRHELGWEPAWTVEAGLEALIAWLGQADAGAR